MDKQGENRSGNYVQRHLSQLRVITRLVEYELDAAKGEEVVLDRQLLESVLDSLDIFVEDLSGTTTGRGPNRPSGDAKPAVARLN